jgi:DNA-binding winged helix-turn-helix (wHTH) protein/tetratricopeptide (TPR) repeat protein
MNQIEFGPFRLDPDNALLKRGNQSLELAPKAFAVLCHLAQRPGQLITKNDLLDAVWGHRFVSESVLKTAINAIRGALTDNPRQPTYIETVARRGYRFIATIGVSVLSAELAPAAARPRLIGRAAALAALAAHLEAVGRGDKRVVLVAGEAGIGKSTLIERFAQQAWAAGMWVGTGQCIEQFGSSEPYLPLLDALALLCRSEDGSTWTEALCKVAPAWLAQLPWLITETDQTRLRGEAAGAAQDRMPREFAAMLDVVTASRALVVVIEDLHWSDHATINLLAYLARRRGPGNWMVLASYRPTDVALNDHPLQAVRQELRLHRLIAEVTLDSFSEQDVDAYLLDRFGTQALPEHERLARDLRAHTDGLPLFVANVVDELVASGGLVRDAAGQWHVTPAAIDDLRVPETIAGVVEKQIARLPGELRSLLEGASVIGNEFAHLVLALALDQDPGLLQERCDGLARRAEWLNSAGMATLADSRLVFRYAFRHALYQRVFYERTEPAQRLQLHLRTAAALKDVYGPQIDRVAAELAVHFERAVAIAIQSGARLAAAAREAATWRIRAARAAAALYAPLDALTHYERALDAEPDVATRARILAERAILLRQVGAGPRAMEESASALALARANGDPDLLRDVSLRRARLCSQSDAPQESIALIGEVLAASQPLSREQRIEALLVLADGKRALGQMQDADAALQAAAAACGDDAPERKASILDTMVMLHYQRGTIEAGLVIADEARALYERVGDLRGAASVLGRIGAFSMLLGRTERAESALREARALTHTLHYVDGERGAILNLAKLRSDRADFAGALELLDAGWRLAPSFESPVTEQAFLQGYYYCHYLRGDLGAALDDAERVLESATPLNAVYWRVGAALLVFDLFVYLGDLDRAAQLIDDAIAQTTANDVPHQRPKVMFKRAWLDAIAGQPARALARLAEIEAAEPVEQPEDRAAIARVRAQAHLLLGDAAAARMALAAFTSAPTAEVWTLMLALRLRAGLALRSVALADLALAQEELRSDRLPRLEGVVLAAATADALRSVGKLNEVEALRARVGSSVAALADSLARWPDRQKRFLASFPASH